MLLQTGFALQRGVAVTSISDLEAWLAGPSPEAADTALRLKRTPKTAEVRITVNLISRR